MNKSELVGKVKEILVEKLSEDVKVTNKLNNEIVDSIFEVIAEALLKDDEVVLPGIGRLKVVEKAGRKGEVTRPDGTKIPYETAPGKRIKFVVGSKLKERING